jgi:hypothetical protein
MGQFAFSNQTRVNKTLTERADEVRDKLPRVPELPRRYKHRQGEMWSGSRKIRPWN